MSVNSARPGAVTHIFMEQRVANTVSSSSTRYRQVHLLPRVLSTLTRTTDRIITWNVFDEIRWIMQVTLLTAISLFHLSWCGKLHEDGSDMIFKVWNFYLKLLFIGTFAFIISTVFFLRNIKVLFFCNENILVDYFYFCVIYFTFLKWIFFSIIQHTDFNLTRTTFACTR